MLRGLWTSAVTVVATVVLGIPAMVINLLRPGTNATLVLGRIWSRIILWAAGVRVTYVGLDNLRAHRPCIYISNHLSNIDICALMVVLPIETRFVAKQSLFRIPLFGTILNTAEFISIDRTNRSRAIRSLEIAAEKIRSGRPVVVFPEGTRSRSGELQPFKKGPFHLALQAGVPVVPVVIEGSGRIMPPGSARVTAGDVTVRALAPMDVTPFRPDDLTGVMDAVRAAMEKAASAPASEPLEVGAR